MERKIVARPNVVEAGIGAATMGYVYDVIDDMKHVITCWKPLAVAPPLLPLDIIGELHM